MKQPMTVVQFVVAVLVLAVIGGGLYFLFTRDDAEPTAPVVQLAPSTTVPPEVQITSCDPPIARGTATNQSDRNADFYITVGWDGPAGEVIVSDVKPGETRAWQLNFATYDVRPGRCSIANIRRAGLPK